MGEVSQTLESWRLGQSFAVQKARSAPFSCQAQKSTASSQHDPGGGSPRGDSCHVFRMFYLRTHCRRCISLSSIRNAFGRIPAMACEPWFHSAGMRPLRFTRDARRVAQCRISSVEDHPISWVGDHLAERFLLRRRRWSAPNHVDIRSDRPIGSN